MIFLHCSSVNLLPGIGGREQEKNQFSRNLLFVRHERTGKCDVSRLFCIEQPPIYSVDIVGLDGFPSFGFFAVNRLLLL